MKISIKNKVYKIKMLTAAQLIAARLEAIGELKQMDTEQSGEKALIYNATLTKHCLHKGIFRAFKTVKAVLNRFTAEDIMLVASIYYSEAEKKSPLYSLEKDDIEYLKKV